MLAPAVASGQSISTQTARPGNQLIPAAEIVHMFVDDEGLLYRQRYYQGIIPSIRDYMGTKPPKKDTKHTNITWIGFQQKELYSRIFIQTNRPSHFTLSKPNATTIIVSFDNTRIPRSNERRPLITGAFQTRVLDIRPHVRRGRAEIEIRLMADAGYLYKQNGSYVFIDIER